MYLQKDKNDLLSFLDPYSTEIDSQSLRRNLQCFIKKVYGLEFYLAKKNELTYKKKVMFTK